MTIFPILFLTLVMASKLEVTRDVYIKSLCEKIEWFSQSKADPDVVIVTPAEGSLFTGKG